MTVIDDELQELKKCCENVIPDSKLIACVAAMIRVELKKSVFKTMAVCFTYPTNYPTNHILVEIKSKTLSRKLLDGLEKVAEVEAKRYIGKPHVLFILKFINQFFDDNPLACCSEEISEVKKLLGEDDKFKLSQKTSSICVQVSKNKYFFKAKIKVPNNYPLERITLENIESNFPRIFKAWFSEQAKEIARRCVEPPLKVSVRSAAIGSAPNIYIRVILNIKNLIIAISAVTAISAFS